MFANIPVCYVHRRISGLSFLHRRKHQSLPPHTQEVLCNVSFFPELFQLDVLFMCCTHAGSLSLSLPPFLPLISTMHLQDKETFHMQTAKKCYSTHSIFLFSSTVSLIHMHTCTQYEHSFHPSYSKYYYHTHHRTDALQ